MDTYSRNAVQEEGNDRRFLPRWETNLLVSWKKVNGNCLRNGVVKSLGCGGARLYGDAVFAPHEAVHLIIELSDKTLIEVSGTVRWTGEEDGKRVAGIFFLNMDDATHDIILYRVLRDQNIILRDYMFNGWKGNSASKRT